MLPDATQLLDYMLTRYTKVLSQLVIDQKQMLNNIFMTYGVIFAQRVMNRLILNGWTREQAYDAIQPLAMAAYNQKKQFQDLLLNNKTIMRHISKPQLHSCFDLKYYFKNVPYIYKKVGI